MNESTNTPCISLFVHWNINKYVPNYYTSVCRDQFKYWRGCVCSILPPIYPNSLAELLFAEEAATRVVPECLRARRKSSVKEKMVKIVEGVPTGMRGGKQSDNFTFVDALTCTNLIEYSDPGIVSDRSGMPIYEYYIVR